MDTSHLQTILNETIEEFHDKDVSIIKQGILIHQTTLHTIEKEIAITNRKIEQMDSHYTFDTHAKKEKIVDSLHLYLQEYKEKRTDHLFRKRILETLINMKE